MSWPGITFEGSPAWIFLIPVACAFAIWIYRSCSRIGSRVRIILGALRSICLALVLICLAQPVLTHTRAASERPSLAALVDDSGSMQVRDAAEEGATGASRGEKVREVLHSRAWTNLSKRFDLSIIAFSASARRLPPECSDSLTFSGPGTDLAGAIRTAGETRPAAMLLLSDGADNAGGDVDAAAGAAGVPIHVIGVGGASELPFLKVSDVLAKGPVIVGVPMTIYARVSDLGDAGGAAIVELRGESRGRGSRMLGRIQVPLSGDGRSQDVSFQTTPPPGEPGVWRYTVMASTAKATGPSLKDSSSAYVAVAKARLSVLLLAGAPSWESAFLKRTLERIQVVDLKSSVWTGEGGEWTDEGPKGLEADDLLVLVDCPPEALGAGLDGRIAAFVRKGGPLLFVGGPHTLGRGYRGLLAGNLLPVVPADREKAYNPGEFVLQLTETGRQHPVMGIAAAGEIADQTWRDLPPFTGWNDVQGVRPGAVILATRAASGARADRAPAVVAGTAGRGMVMVTLCSPFWRAEFMQFGAGGNGEAVRSFWRKAVLWLTSPQASQPLTLTTERPAYRSGEPIVFQGAVLDPTLSQGAPVEVAVRLQGPPERRAIYLAPGGNGSYSAMMQGLQAGDYRFEGTASSGDRVLGKAAGTFTVFRETAESGDTRPNEALLSMIAQRSRGSYRAIKEAESAIDDLQSGQIGERETTQFRPGRSLWVWLLAVLLASAEWVTRKAVGLT